MRRSDDNGLSAAVLERGYVDATLVDRYVNRLHADRPGRRDRLADLGGAVPGVLERSAPHAGVGERPQREDDALGESGAHDQVVRPAPRIHSIAALKDAVWMVPDGDGWAEVFGDGDGWADWDVEIWAPAVSYGDRWVVPNGDGWSPCELHDS